MQKKLRFAISPLRRAIASVRPRVCRLIPIALMALGCVPCCLAQSDSTRWTKSSALTEQAFTFTEAQLGEDDDMSQNVTIINSNNNSYASEVGYLFSPVRFRYRAFAQKYNDVYLNGVPMNDIESGQFRYSLVGGLNQQTRNVEFALPFESNNFSMAGMAGSNNYNFRPGSFATGQRVTLSGANRNYKIRVMYTYNSGFNDNGWAFSGNLTYRGATEGYVDGTFYNALSYYLGVQKMTADGTHSFTFATWGNPTERSTQGPATDETLWLANDKYYNPYWGYQNGEKRNSRIVTDFAPSGVFTWDWKINDKMKLTTSLAGKYSMYKSTKLNYNNADNPHPNYWKNLPSSYYDVWDEDDSDNRTAQNLADWNTAYEYWTSSESNRQINWDRLYYANSQMNAVGSDAMYFIQAKHNDALTFTLSSSLDVQLDDKKKLNIGIAAATNKGMHYQTMEDLLGADTYHNINTYALGTYAETSDEVQYDLNNPNAEVKEGDTFGYDYNILVNKAQLWTSYSENIGPLHYYLAAKIGYTSMQRDGKMRNGLAPDNSYGKSHTAQFVDGGGKFGASLNLGGGSTITLGLGYELKAPQASTAFAAPEINNDFVLDLKDEKVFSSEISYQLQNSWIHLNLNAYYSRMTDVTEWQNFYYDDINSFSYVSLTDIKKEAYGVEAGINIKLSSAFNLKLIGTISEAKNVNNSHVRYMESTSGEYYGYTGQETSTDKYNEYTCYNKGMRESGTPLTAASVGISFHQGGWYIDLNCNYYDRIYLSYAPNQRYLKTWNARTEAYDDTWIGDEINPEILEQAKGHGGFMLDGSIGKNIYLKRGSLSINLSVTNILNNENICTGGYEQSRSSWTESGNKRIYRFDKNPLKYYAYGCNGMLNIAYKF